jgi:hypothetical protein
MSERNIYVYIMKGESSGGGLVAQFEITAEQREAGEAFVLPELPTLKLGRRFRVIVVEAESALAAQLKVGLARPKAALQ